MGFLKSKKDTRKRPLLPPADSNKRTQICDKEMAVRVK
jgi:hypothetical protein